MVREVIDLLGVRRGRRYCDGTVGGGGHAGRILEACGPDGRLLGIDRDPEAIARAREVLAPYRDRVTLRRGNFSDVPAILGSADMAPVDGVVLDLGVSSHQLETPGRGFSFTLDGPLDMRMDPSSGLSAAEFLEASTVDGLAEAIRTLGEEPASRRVARAIRAALDGGTLRRTSDLARVVAGSVGAGRRGGLHPATRTFQALRMAVNDELGALERFLDSFDRVLAPGGRVAVIAFHSLEDRAVKRRFASLARGCTCPAGLPVCACSGRPRLRVLTRRPLRPTSAEIARNPRARSARLRAAERI